MDSPPTSKGHLNPDGAVTMIRLPPGPVAAELVRHYWIPKWELPAGAVERQVVLAYPACNLVVQPSGVTLAGPTTRATHRDLAGRSWAVGALLRPAAGVLVLRSALCRDLGQASGPPTVAASVDQEWALESDAAAELAQGVTSAMIGAGPSQAAAVLEEHLLALLGEPSAEGLLANRLQEAVESRAPDDPAQPGAEDRAADGSPTTRVDELARRLAISTRSLQRLAHDYIGMSPAAMIRRRRLQDAADTVRRSPDADLSRIAAEHGYADHAHLTRDFRRVLGFTPSEYRSGA
jgi:AraC-like DNA-binding protein